MTEATAKKRSRTPLSYLLCSVQKDGEGNVVSLTPVPQPTVEKNSRADFKRAVRKCLEDGVNAEHYNGRQLTVVSFPEPFTFKAEVETVEIRKVSVTES
jgi:hypothetical protein